MEENTQKLLCPNCKAEIAEDAYFCSNCGRAIKARPEDTSVPKQILVYFVSFFLAPFGLGFAFSYLRQSDKKAKIIGGISLVLTILAVITVVLLALSYTKQQYNDINLILGGGL